MVGSGQGFSGGARARAARQLMHLAPEGFLPVAGGRLGIGGLQRVRYSDETPQDALQAEELLQFEDKLDRIYYQLPGALTLQSGSHTLRLEQQGFTDAVVWNPGAQDAAALPDLADDEYQRFICIEPALIQPDTLAAGAAWVGRQRLEFV